MTHTPDNRLTGIDPATGAGIFVDLRDGVIVARGACDDPAPGYLAPGLMDLQVNGYGGLDLNDGALTADRVLKLCEKLASLGVSQFLPTVITAAQEQILQALDTLRLACETHSLAARMIVGVHVEGPYISPLDGARGAHPIDHVRYPDLAEFDAWQAASGGRVRMITLAPEVDGALPFIKTACKAGVAVAIGHSTAEPADIHAAAAAGARFSTHLGNGVAGQMPRHPNLIWAQLAQDDLNATLIADGHHLPADTFQVMLRAKTLARCVLVSDSVALAGMPAGRYSAPIGSDVDVSADGKVNLAGTPYLAGAGLPLIANVAIAVRIGRLTLEQALMLATDNPRRMLGLPAGLAVGTRADVIRFDLPEGADRLHLLDHWINGEQVPL